MAKSYAPVRSKRQKRGTMAGFYRRCEAFYAQIDWDLECERRRRVDWKCTQNKPALPKSGTEGMHSDKSLVGLLLEKKEA